MKIIIAGDIRPSIHNDEEFSSGNVNGLFNDLVSIIEEADLSIFNLETPITNSQEKIDKIGPCFKAPVLSAKTIRKAGFMIAGLANNHIRDYGDVGVIDTLRLCHEAGLQTVGAGRDLNDARKPIIRKIGDIRIGVLGFSDQEFSCATRVNAGANPFDALISIDEIRGCKSGCDFLIVLYHSGIENYQYQTPQLQRRCRKMTEAGADVVVCQHSHCIGTYENYNGSHIVYGQGNFLFESQSKRKTWREGLLISLEITGKRDSSCTFIPSLINNGTVKIANKEKTAEILAEFEQRNRNAASSVYLEQAFRQMANDRLDAYVIGIHVKNPYLAKVLEKIGVGRLYLSRYKKNKYMDYLLCDSHKEILEEILKT